MSIKRNQTAWDAIRWIEVVNQASESIPPYGLMTITGISNDGYFQVNQPTSNGQTGLLINGPFEIRAGDYGSGHNSYPAAVAYDQNDGAPTAGSTWGAAANSWYLTKGQTGYMTLTAAANGLVNVTASASSSSTGPTYTSTDVTIYDSTATISNATSLAFDLGSGFALAPHGTTSGVAATIALVPATALHQGVVSTSAQTFAGNKTFDNHIIISQNVTLTMSCDNYNSTLGYYYTLLNVSGYTGGVTNANLYLGAVPYSDLGITPSTTVYLVFNGSIQAGEGFNVAGTNGATEDVTISGTTLHYKGGMYTGHS